MLTELGKIIDLNIDHFVLSLPAKLSNRNIYFILYIEINSRSIKHVNIKGKTVNNMKKY